MVAAMIVVQRDVDGDLLINGWHGLALTAVVCLIGSALCFKSAVDALLD
jgi:hypothetical protein